MRHRKGSGWHKGVTSEVRIVKKDEHGEGMRDIYKKEKDGHARTVRTANLRSKMYGQTEGRRAEGGEIKEKIKRFQERGGERETRKEREKERDEASGWKMAQDRQRGRDREGDVGRLCGRKRDKD